MNDELEIAWIGMLMTCVRVLTFTSRGLRKTVMNLSG
jgi:hypothetical protein